MTGDDCMLLYVIERFLLAWDMAGAWFPEVQSQTFLTVYCNQHFADEKNI